MRPCGVLMPLKSNELNPVGTPRCSMKVFMKKMTCPHCGMPMRADKPICPHCDNYVKANFLRYMLACIRSHWLLLVLAFLFYCFLSYVVLNYIFLV